METQELYIGAGYDISYKVMFQNCSVYSSIYSVYDSNSLCQLAYYPTKLYNSVQISYCQLFLFQNGAIFCKYKQYAYSINICKERDVYNFKYSAKTKFVLTNFFSLYPWRISFVSLFQDQKTFFK